MTRSQKKRKRKGKKRKKKKEREEEVRGFGLINLPGRRGGGGGEKEGGRKGVLASSPYRDLSIPRPPPPSRSLSLSHCLFPGSSIVLHFFFVFVNRETECSCTVMQVSRQISSFDGFGDCGKVGTDIHSCLTCGNGRFGPPAQ